MMQQRLKVEIEPACRPGDLPSEQPSTPPNTLAANHLASAATSADHAALAYPVEFLVKRRLLIFDGATGAVDGVVNGIVECA